MSHAVRTSNAKSLAEALVVWFFWTGATGVGLGIANAISFWLFFIAFFALQTDIGVLGYAIVATIGALIGGSLLALCYLLVLRLPQEKWLGWFLWMCLAWLLTAAVVVLVFATSLFRDTQIYVLNPALLAVVGGVWVGTVFAICQWRTLRHLYAGMRWWILASILGWILYFQFINYLAKLPLLDSFWKIILAGGMIVGMVTGVVLAGFKGQSDRRVLNTSVLSVVSFLLIGIPVVWLTQVYSQQRMVLAAASPGAMVSEVAFSPDGRMLATLDGQLSIWDLASGKRIHSRSLSNSLRSSLAFSPDGKLVAASNQNGSKVSLWNIKSGQEWIISQKQVNDLAFSPDGSLLAIGAGGFKDGGVTLWDMAANRASGTSARQFWVTSVAFSRDGQFLAYASRDNSIHVRDVLSGKYIDVFEWKNGEVNSILFSPDGHFLMAGGTTKAADDQTVRIWKVNQRKSPRIQDVTKDKEVRFLDITKDVDAMALSPDGGLLAISLGMVERDEAIYLYELSSGRLIGTLRGHLARIKCLAFSPDGQSLASGSHDGTTRLWNIPPYEPLAASD